MKKILVTILSLALVFSFNISGNIKADTTYKVASIQNFSEFNSVPQTTSTIMQNGTCSAIFTVDDDCYVRTCGTFKTSSYYSVNAKITSLNETTNFTDSLNSDSYISSGNKTVSINTYAKLKKGTYKIIYETSDTSVSYEMRVTIAAIYKQSLTTLSFVKEINANTAMVKINHIDSIDEVSVYMSNNEVSSPTSIKYAGEKVSVDSNNQILIPLKDKGYYHCINLLLTDASGYKSVIYKHIMTQSTTTVKNIQNKAYTGKAIIQKPQLNVGWFYADIPTYKITYKNNVNPGTATITFTGTGAWIGSVTKTFKISKNRDKTKPTVKGVKNNKTYKRAVKIRFFDKSGIKKATLNGKKIKSGKKVKKKGKYKLIVIDNAGNKTIIKFKIKRKK